MITNQQCVFRQIKNENILEHHMNQSVKRKFTHCSFQESCTSWGQMRKLKEPRPQYMGG
jgi:hypothetical protein